MLPNNHQTHQTSATGVCTYTAKRMYRTKQDATNAASTTTRRTEDTAYSLSIYKCKACKTWHLGYQRKGKRQP